MKEVLNEQTIEIPKNHPSMSSERRMLSLKNLSEKLRKKPNDKKLFNLLGLSWVEGYVVDEENNDILLFGREAENWPNLTLDDFITNTKNVFNNEPYPYCSLDPLPEYTKKFHGELNNLPKDLSFDVYLAKVRELCGPQKVVVGGVPQTSHHALVMLEADYHMKKVSQGLVKLPPLISTMGNDHNSFFEQLLDENNNSPSSNQSRFWFNCKEGQPQFQYAEDIVMLDNCDVVVLTEAQKSKRDGTLYDSGEINQEAEQFAEIFSTYFMHAAVNVKEYAELENLYRLQAVLRAIYFKEDISFCKEVFQYYLNEHPYTYNYNIPETYPALANARRISYDYMEDGYMKTRSKVQNVSGGVSMLIKVDNKAFIEKNQETLKKEKALIIKNIKKNKKAVSWKMKVAA